MRTFPLFCGLLALLTPPLLHAQDDLTFASTGQQKLIVNPAFAAGSRGLEYQALASFRHASQTYYNGASYGLKNFGFGLSNTFNVAWYDAHPWSELAMESTISTRTDASLAYRIKLSSKITLVPSAQVSYVYNQVDPGWYYAMNFDMLIAPARYVPKAYFGVSSGLLFDFNKRITAGVAFYDLNQPEKDYYGRKAPLRQVYHVSGLLLKDKPVTVQPYLVVSLTNDTYLESAMALGVYTTYKFVTVHLGCQNLSSLVAGASFTFKGIRMGYNFEHGSAWWYPNNTHEAFLSVGLFTKQKQPLRNLMLN